MLFFIWLLRGYVDECCTKYQGFLPRVVERTHVRGTKRVFALSCCLETKLGALKRVVMHNILDLVYYLPFSRT